MFKVLAFSACAQCCLSPCAGSAAACGCIAVSSRMRSRCMIGMVCLAMSVCHGVSCTAAFEAGQPTHVTTKDHTKILAQDSKSIELETHHV